MESTSSGSTSAPSLAMTVSLCCSTVSCRGQTVVDAPITLNLYLRPCLAWKLSSDVLVTWPVIGSLSKNVVTEWSQGRLCPYCMSQTHYSLSLSVDEDALGVMSFVLDDSSRKDLPRISVQPITEQHHVWSRVLVISVTVRILRQRPSDDQTSVNTVHHVQTLCSAVDS